MKQPEKSHRYLLLTLMIVFIQGVVRLTIVPAWGHYDEPTHYEYMEYIIEHHTLPDPERPDFELGTRIVQTFNAVLDVNCEGIHSKGDCLYVGQQFGEVPGYYLFQVLFQWIVRPSTILGQLRLARLISLFLLIGTAWLSYLTVRQTFPEKPILALGTPLTMSVVFGFTDLMTALSNDVGAVFAMTSLVFAVTLLFSQGANARTIGLLLLGMFLCLVTKSSAWLGIPLAIIGVGIYILPRSNTNVKIVALIAGLLLATWAIIWKPGVGPLLNPTINKYFPWGGANVRLVGWYRPQNWPYYFTAIRWQFVTFWSGFGTGYPGLPVWGVAFFAALTLVSAIGLVRAFRKHFSHLKLYQKQIVLFFLIVVLSILAMSLIRIDPPEGYIPTARHFYNAIVPTILFFLIGLGQWLPSSQQRYGLAGLLIIFFLIGVWSILNIQMPYFLATGPIGN